MRSSDGCRAVRADLPKSVFRRGATQHGVREPAAVSQLAVRLSLKMDSIGLRPRAAHGDPDAAEAGKLTWACGEVERPAVFVVAPARRCHRIGILRAIAPERELFGVAPKGRC